MRSDPRTARTPRPRARRRPSARGRGTSTRWRGSSRRRAMDDAGAWRRDGAVDAWTPAGAPPLRAVLEGPVDPDWLLTRPDCDIVKYDGKVWVGRVRTPAGVLYVKRYARHPLRMAAEAALVGSPARRAATAARRLAAAGFATPRVCAAVEVRRAGAVTKSFLLTHEVAGGLTADSYWRRLAA